MPPGYANHECVDERAQLVMAASAKDTPPAGVQRSIPALEHDLAERVARLELSVRLP
jgi:hypothetical protein